MSSGVFIFIYFYLFLFYLFNLLASTKHDRNQQMKKWTHESNLIEALEAAQTKKAQFKVNGHSLVCRSTGHSV